MKIIPIGIIYFFYNRTTFIKTIFDPKRNLDLCVGEDKKPARLKIKNIFSNFNKDCFMDAYLYYSSVFFKF
jgi:hypothetical protein